MEENNEGFPRVCDASLPSPQEGSSRKTSDTIYLKVLVPSVAAGAIIGKNGEAIGQMQKETGAKIKLSKLNDFYPGTTERVCLIQGPLAGVRAMHSYIMERILEKPEVSSQAMTPTGTVGSEQAAEPAYISPPAYVLSRPSGAVWPVVYGSGAPTAAVGGQQPPPPPPAPPISGNRLLWERHKQALQGFNGYTGGGAGCPYTVVRLWSPVGLSLVISKTRSLRDLFGCLANVRRSGSQGLSAPLVDIQGCNSLDILTVSCSLSLQVKILVPNCTAGLVIGKQGSYVSEIKEATGAFIQISQKSKEINLPERCITIAGELDQLRAAVDMVLTKIAEDPQSGTCPNISYSHTQGPVASAYPTGSPFAYNPTLQAQPIVSSRHSTPIVRQKSDGSGAVSMGGAYYHAALQATYLAAAAADYQQRLLAAGYHHRPHRGDGQSGDASGGSSSLESGGGGGANYGAPITPPSEQETPPFFTAPLLPAAAAGQMILHPSPSSPYELTPRFGKTLFLFGNSKNLRGNNFPLLAFFQPNSSAGTTATGGVYASAGLESPPAPIVESAAFPLVASPPPQSSGPHHAFGGGGGVGGASAAFFPSTSAYAVRASPPLSYAGTTAATTTTAAWLRTRGFSEDAVAEITHAISTLSAHGVLNFRTVTSTDPMLITTAPVASMSQPPPIGPASQQQQQQQQQQQAPGVDVEGMEGEADFPGNNSTAINCLYFLLPLLLLPLLLVIESIHTRPPGNAPKSARPRAPSMISVPTTTTSSSSF
ncbi:unnamed protein product [Mesocestoides corti]|uniref:K Homology domain-containing protein n=1 Tax=Mesocestoides corti TaxID=53468 RepID=A0A0R3UG14_MESCO|nr:unnamed protein product [Mesocestoides corti]